MSHRTFDDENEDLRQLIDRPRIWTRMLHDARILRAARAPRRRGWRYARHIVLAGGFVVVTLGLYVSTHLPGGDDDVVRSRSSIASESVSPAIGLSLRVPPGEFRWPVQSGARSYGLILRDASGVVIWRSQPLKTNHVQLDQAFTGRLTPHTYYWSVEVEREEARLELGPFWFRLVDP